MIMGSVSETRDGGKGYQKWRILAKLMFYVDPGLSFVDPGRILFFCVSSLPLFSESIRTRKSDDSLPGTEQPFF